MDAAAHFWGLMVVAFAIYAGCDRIAEAIRYRTVDVKFSDPIRVEHQGPANGPR